jgi:hypothetical protein
MGWPAAHIAAVENITAKSTLKNDMLMTIYHTFSA